MNSSLATLFKFEVLHGIAHVQLIAGDTGVAECAIEDLACGSDEGAACTVLLIARLLADQRNASCRGSFSEDGLGGAAEEIAAFATADSFTENSEVSGARNKRSRRTGCIGDHAFHARLCIENELADGSRFRQRSPAADRHI